MAVGIGVQGGSTRDVALKNIGGVESQKALDSLEQIRTHLSRPGRDSGVLTLFNRTKDGSEMTLERKSGFKLLFQKKERLDDTVRAVKTLLHKAGKKEALKELDAYLGSSAGKGNRIESGKMLDILNRHLRAQGSGENRQSPLPQSAPSQDTVEVSAARKAVPYLSASVDKPPEGVVPAMGKSGLQHLYESQGIEKTRELGSGNYGTTHLVTVDGKERVLKEFSTPQRLTLKRGPDEEGNARFNESTAAYLSSPKHGDYLLKKVNISQPTSYLISQDTELGREYRTVTPHEMRKLVKEADKSDTTVLCHGLVMDKAKGKEIEKLIGEGLGTTEKKQCLAGTLHSIKGLNERGFVHRDIKPANLFFDKETGATTLIDTGTLFKSSTKAKHPESEYIQGEGSPGTGIFQHPRAHRSEKHGTETDLWALGITALQVDHPLAFEQLLREKRPDDGIDKAWLSQTVDRLIGTAKGPDVRQALEALRKDIDDPRSLASFSLDCLDKARLGADHWNTRELAQKTYEELVNHPALR